MSCPQRDGRAVDGDGHAGVVVVLVAAAAMEIMLLLRLRGGRRGRGGSRQIRATGGTRPHRAGDTSAKEGAQPQGPGGAAARGCYAQRKAQHRHGRWLAGWLAAPGKLRTGPLALQPGRAAAEALVHDAQEGPIVRPRRREARVTSEVGVWGAATTKGQPTAAGEKKERDEQFKQPTAGSSQDSVLFLPCAGPAGGGGSPLDVVVAQKRSVKKPRR